MANNTHSWLEVFRKDYGISAGQTRVLTTIVFDGYQYVGIGRPNIDGTAQVYRRSLQSNNKWMACAPNWPTSGPHSNPSGDVMVMAVVNQTLFLGNDKGCVYFTTTGKTWDLAYQHDSAGYVNAIAEFDNNLYIAISGDIVRGKVYPTGIIFTQVVGKSTKYPGTFGGHDLHTLEVFDKHLYAGVGKDNANGIQLWRTNNGTFWELFHDLKPPAVVAYLPPGHIHAMKSFKNHLYIGAYHGNYLYRTDGTKSPSATHWEIIESKISSTGDILRLEECQGYLYMGLAYISHSPSQPEDLIYASSDGKSWKKVSGAPQYDTSNIAVSLLKELNGKLYVGDFGPGLSKPTDSGSLIMWEMEGPLKNPLFLGQIPDLHEKNDTPKSAISIQMDTKNKGLYSINDLSLGVGDIDFLHIKFSTDQKGCQTGNKVIGFFGGLCTAEVGNSSLMIKIPQEQCVPLNLQILHADQTVYDHNQFFNGNDVYIECPDDSFGGDILLKICNIKGNPALKYAVQLELSEGFFFGKCRKPLYKFWEYEMPPWQGFIDPRQRFREFEDLIAAFEEGLKAHGQWLVRYSEGEMNHGLGRLAMEVGQTEIAEQRLRLSIEMFGELELNGKRASVLRDLGRFHSLLGHASEAEEYFAEAMELHRSEADFTEFALDELLVAKHSLEVSPEEALMLSSHAFSVFNDQPEMWEEKIEALMIQSAAFAKLKEYEPAVAAVYLGKQLSAEKKDTDRLRQAYEQAVELAEMMGVREYLGLETTIREKAEITIESRVAKFKRDTLSDGS
ncbi:MAG: tetratricopeptide repeat protein [Desulfobacterales bacterium]